MPYSAITFGLMFLTVAAISAGIGFGAVANQSGNGGKVVAAVCLALAVLAFAIGWVNHRRAAARLVTNNRWTAWLH